MWAHANVIPDYNFLYHVNRVYRKNIDSDSRLYGLIICVFWATNMNETNMSKVQELCLR
jgi:hypothetical protein